MYVLVTSKNEEDQMKNEGVRLVTTLYYRFKLVWASSFMGVKAFVQLFSMPLEETCISGILGCGLGLKEEFIPGSCN